MHPDVDLAKFVLYFGSQVRMNLTDRIVDASISRSIDASTELSVTINDYDRRLLTSGWLTDRLDVQIENLWFRLKGVEKSGDNITLKFEDREIAVLRTYTRWKIADRSTTTRAEFIYSLIREVKEFVIPTVIPELHMVQPIQRYSDDPLGMDAVINKSKGSFVTPAEAKPEKLLIQNSFIAGLPKGKGLTVKKVPIDDEQLRNANIIMAVGNAMMSANNNHRRKIIVCAIMTAIDESVLRNIDHGDRDSVGLFQQRDSWGSFEDRMNAETSSRLFYNQAIPEDKSNPNLSFNDLCQKVQKSGTPYAYGQYQQEAEAIVNHFGIVGTDGEMPAQEFNGQSPKITKSNSGDYFFWRGTIYDRNSMKFRKPENSWSCIQRLADVVGWKAFFVSGTFYYMSEDDMLKQAPLTLLTEFQDGITDISGDYDNQKKSATLTIQARVGKWAVPPGSLVTVENMGPWNGRWIVSEFDRSLFDLNATISLTKSSPALPEEFGGNENDFGNRTQWLPGGGGSSKTTAGTTVPSKDIILTDDRITLAKQLLTYHGLGKWRDENGRGLEQIQKVANGMTLTSPIGPQVELDVRTMMVVLWLIGQGYTIGTYAWCEDHSSPDGMSGHQGGHAVDISSININPISSSSSGQLVIAVDTLLNKQTPLEIHPRQLISGGFGNHTSPICISLCITDPVGRDPIGYYTQGVINEHCNHIHVGY